MVVENNDGEQSFYKYIANNLESLSVIRTTSPIDGKSTWIEIFPSSVSKSQAAEWLRLKCNIPRTRVMAVGNDYNDLDLLKWAHRSYVVGNAPNDLKSRFQIVAVNTQNGFSEAVSHWIEKEHHRS